MSYLAACLAVGLIVWIIVAAWISTGTLGLDDPR